MGVDTDRCPICAERGVTDQYDGEVHAYVCPHCGSFRLDKRAYLALPVPNHSLRSRDYYYARKCESVMLERNLKHLNDSILISYSQEKNLFFSETGAALEDFYPRSFLEKLERGFFNIVRALPFSTFVSFFTECFHHDLSSMLFVCDYNEDPKSLLSLMAKQGWISYSTQGKYSFTVEGMNLFEAKGRAPDSIKAFLAMWFGVNGNKAYREAVNSAVESAGYRLQVVDKEDYNGFIMDKVVNLINDSAFVIADISAAPERITKKGVSNGVRGGVYWEAGYAAGQKKQVILTCRADKTTEQRVHFDLQQYNQIRWNVKDGVVKTCGRDFVDVLKQRILATVGKGTFGVSASLR